MMSLGTALGDSAPVVLASRDYPPVRSNRYGLAQIFVEEILVALGPCRE